MTGKWEELLKQVKVSGGNLAPANRIQLYLIEKCLGLKLPQEYREYLAVFGPGSFGGNYSVSGPYPGHPYELVLFHPMMARNISDVVQRERAAFARRGDSVEAQRAEQYLAQLRHMLFFGDAGEDVIFAFDLTSYRVDDRAYDILAWVHFFNYGGESTTVCGLGRSFWTFISGFLLGNEGTKPPCLKGTWLAEGDFIIDHTFYPYVDPKPPF